MFAVAFAGSSECIEDPAFLPMAGSLYLRKIVSRYFFPDPRLIPDFSIRSLYSITSIMSQGSPCHHLADNIVRKAIRVLEKYILR